MKAIIIEDEEMIANLLLGKIKKIAPEIEVIAVLSSLKRAKNWFGENAEPDLMFMDIQLSDGVSMDLFNHFQFKCPVIFTTAYDEYALRAFKVNGVDYLLKPVKDEELSAAIEKCKKIIKSNQPISENLQNLFAAWGNNDNTIKYKEKFVVNFGNQWIPVQTKDIACFTKDLVNHVYTMSGERYSLDFISLDEIEEILDPKKFFRANRQNIINIDAIQAVKPIENSKLIIRLKEPNHKLEIDTSRQKSPEFKKWLEI